MHSPCPRHNPRQFVWTRFGNIRLFHKSESTDMSENVFINRGPAKTCNRRANIDTILAVGTAQALLLAPQAQIHQGKQITIA